jgi:hypothetical protein
VLRILTLPIVAGPKCGINKLMHHVVEVTEDQADKCDGDCPFKRWLVIKD